MATIIINPNTGKPTEGQGQPRVVFMIGPPEAVKQNQFSAGPSEDWRSLVPLMQEGWLIVGKNEHGDITTLRVLRSGQLIRPAYTEMIGLLPPNPSEKPVE